MTRSIFCVEHIPSFWTGSKAAKALSIVLLLCLVSNSNGKHLSAHQITTRPVAVSGLRPSIGMPAAPRAHLRGGLSSAWMLPVRCRRWDAWWSGCRRWWMLVHHESEGIVCLPVVQRHGHERVWELLILPGTGPCAALVCRVWKLNSPLLLRRPIKPSSGRGGRLWRKRWWTWGVHVLVHGMGLSSSRWSHLTVARTAFTSYICIVAAPSNNIIWWWCQKQLVETFACRAKTTDFTWQRSYRTRTRGGKLRDRKRRAIVRSRAWTSLHFLKPHAALPRPPITDQVTPGAAYATGNILPSRSTKRHVSSFFRHGCGEQQSLPSSCRAWVGDWASWE